jgi:hypothetical protein
MKQRIFEEDDSSRGVFGLHELNEDILNDRAVDQ